jgi:hypothetical protein
MGVKRLAPALLAAAGLLVAAPAADAAFAPRLSLMLDPASPHAAPAITATLTQLAGDTPARRFTLAFPAGFTLQHPSGVETCSARLRRARRCGRPSEIGSLEAVAASGVRLRGSVNLARVGRARQIVALVRGAAGIPSQSFTGHARMGPSGGPQLTLDGLPSLPLVSLTIRLTGGPRGMLRTPGSCGANTVQGLLTSQLGELAIGLAEVQIVGC